MSQIFNFNRLFAIISKEFMHIRRDRVTIGMLLIIPLIQLVLFGFAINISPRHLPTAIVSGDHSTVVRKIIYALKNTNYFDIVQSNISEKQAIDGLKSGKLQFIINIPEDFTTKLVKQQYPNILVTADASDPVSTSSAIRALLQLPNWIVQQNFLPELSYLKPKQAPFSFLIHSKYNPESITQYNIIPGLMGVILTMTLIMITTLSITRERETGTMENLLAMPFKPAEVMIGKVIPYIITGYIQQIVILLAAFYIFNTPISGSVLLLALLTLPFILANLFVGLTFSTLAANQLQAIQMTFFFFLPSILLSGFMFPFYGMPVWAQWLGQCLPLTHFVRITRGIMLKNAGIDIMWSNLWPMLIFIIVMGTVCILRFKKKLD